MLFITSHLLILCHGTGRSADDRNVIWGGVSRPYFYKPQIMFINTSGVWGQKPPNQIMWPQGHSYYVLESVELTSFFCLAVFIR
jgi:hypothetical protein